jgi:gas vesicle protein
MPNKKISFIEGAVIGTALGVAAGLFMQTKKGKKIQKNAKEKAAEFYAYIAPKIKNMKQVSEKEFSEFIENAADNYGKAKKYTSEELKALMAEAKNAWKHLKKHA